MFSESYFLREPLAAPNSRKFDQKIDKKALITVMVPGSAWPPVPKRPWHSALMRRWRGKPYIFREPYYRGVTAAPWSVQIASYFWRKWRPSGDGPVFSTASGAELGLPFGINVIYPAQTIYFREALFLVRTLRPLDGPNTVEI